MRLWKILDSSCPMVRRPDGVGDRYLRDADIVFMAPFDRLTAFQKSYELGLAVLKSTEKWPKHHQFGIAAQARRASRSVSINIAEGASKRGRAEFRRFFDISPGSPAETEVLLRWKS